MTRPTTSADSTSSASRSRSRSHSHSTNQIFPLAHPPPRKSTSKPHHQKRLRLSSRLLLQIQQSSAPRAIPILELFQPSTFGKSILLPDGSTRKVHGRDLYLTQSDMFTHLRRRRGHGNGNSSGSADGNGYLSVNGHGYVNGTKPRSSSGASAYSYAGSAASGASFRRKSKSSYDGTGTGTGTGSSGEENEWKAKFRPRRKSKQPPTAVSNGGEESGEEDDVVAIIHPSTKSKSMLKSKTPTTESPTEAELFFPLSSQAWTATSPSPRQYRFQTPSSSIIFTWTSRPASPTTSSSSTEKETERFVLSVLGEGQTTTPTSSLPKSAYLAQLSRQGFRIGGLEEPAIRALIRGCGGDGEGYAGDGMGAGLYTLILTMGVWIARREEWLD